MTDLRERLYRAETAEEIAEICRLEAEQNGSPFWCPTCGVELTEADTLPCKFDYPGYRCGIEQIPPAAKCNHWPGQKRCGVCGMGGSK